MGFVRSKAFGIGTTILIIGGLIYIAKRTGAGDILSKAAFGVGQTAGNVITQPIAGLTNTLSSGITNIADEAKKLFESLGSAGADVQGAFTGNRNAIGDFFSGGQTTSSTTNQTTLNAGAFNTQLITTTGAPTAGKGSVSISGNPQVTNDIREAGFGSPPQTAQQTQTLLESLIAASKRANPQFFQ